MPKPSKFTDSPMVQASKALQGKTKKLLALPLDTHETSPTTSSSVINKSQGKSPITFSLTQAKLISKSVKKTDGDARARLFLNAYLKEKHPKFEEELGTTITLNPKNYPSCSKYRWKKLSERLTPAPTNEEMNMAVDTPTQSPRTVQDSPNSTKKTLSYKE